MTIKDNQNTDYDRFALSSYFQGGRCLGSVLCSVAQLRGVCTSACYLFSVDLWKTNLGHFELVG